MAAWLKLALEAGPLAVFFFVNSQYGLMTATWAFMGATVFSLGLTYGLERKIAILPLVSGVFVLLFGGLTVALDDELFIKMKPTIVNSLFGVILLGGLAMGKPFMKILLGQSLPMRDEGWVIFSRRWAMFFFFLALLNEVVWRGFSTDFWAGFKLFGVMPITIAFTLAQIPLLQKYAPDDEGAPRA